MELRSFYFADPRMFVVPIEELSPEGMSETYGATLREERGVSAAWIELFNRAFRTYADRARRLHAQAPETWFPPRLQNVCIVADAPNTRPYYQPFHQSSWLLYQQDFDPASSSLELAAFLFAYIERFSLARSLAAALVHDLSWFLVLDEPAIADFVEGCRRSSRPDAAGFVALAEAMPWIARLYHEKLKRPVLGLPEPCGRIEAAELIVPVSLGEDLQKLVDRFTGAAHRAVERYFGRFAESPGGIADLVAFLKAERPLVVVTGRDGETLWDPAAPEDTETVAAALEGLCRAAADSIRADLEIVGARSQSFLSALRDAAALPFPGEEIDQAGLTYIHRERKLVAYNLHEGELHRLREPAAPYERLMLGARTLHEWSHLAVDAGIVRLFPEDEARHAEAAAELAERFEDLLRRAPGPLRAVAEREVKALAAPGQSGGEAMVAFFLRRMDDYLANVLARRFLPAAEMETYVRQQVGTLAQEHIGPFAQIARYAYEFQYLRLSGVDDPLRYFLASTWFAEHFVAPGIASEAALADIFSAAGRLCAAYRIDEDAISLPRS